MRGGKKLENKKEEEDKKKKERKEKNKKEEGKREEEREDEREGEYEQLRCMAWNINGWRGEKGDKKIRNIWGEVMRYDVFILRRGKPSTSGSRSTTCSMPTWRKMEGRDWGWR